MGCAYSAGRLRRSRLVATVGSVAVRGSGAAGASTGRVTVAIAFITHSHQSDEIFLTVEGFRVGWVLGGSMRRLDFRLRKRYPPG